MGSVVSKDQTTPILDRVRIPNDLHQLAEHDLKCLAEELRRETIECVSRTGGHLGSGLGVVELTVAIHAVFDTPRDTLIWDVSHQCYPHKILTARRSRMHTLRKEDGLSGFTRRGESSYDPFGAAHSSTAMSAGLGFATARDLNGEDHDVVCVVGDGAMSAGLAYEGLNNAGGQGSRLIVILNDNDMSIAPPVGAFSRHLASSRNCATSAAHRSPTIFEALGFSYVGPVDGHDVGQLLATLRSVKTQREGPVLVHVVTRKGAGYAPAEDASDKYHGVGRFDTATGLQRKGPTGAPSFTKVFGEALAAQAENDKRIVAVTAAMPSGTGVDIFARRFPDRAFDVGIAEQHAVTFCAGMAAAGLRPFCAIYSTFLQRAYDQIVHDVALQGLPVRFAIDRAGLVGADGPTHAGSFDIGYLANLPGFTVMAAADEAELVRMVATAAVHDTGPIAFRYPRGEGTGVPLPEHATPLAIGEGRIVKQGRTVALLSLGGRLAECLAAADELDRMGLSTTVADARFAKPLDEALVRELVEDHEVLITVEEGATGGFGALVLHFLADAGLLKAHADVRTMTLPDIFIEQASPHTMYDRAGLNAEHIVGKVQGVLEVHGTKMQPAKGKVVSLA